MIETLPSETDVMPGLPERMYGSIVTPGIGLGTVCGLLSAVFYTLANISLRQSVSADPLLVTAVKALPTVVCLTPFLVTLKLRGIPITTSRHLVPRFIWICLIGQVGGNASFQVALGMIGLAAAVPITLGALLIGSAIVGRILLGESVLRRTAIAMAILMVAVVMLSQSGHPDPEAAGVVVTDNADELAYQRWIGAGFAIFSGLCFAVFSSTMRFNLQKGMQAATAMWISGGVGFTAMFALVAFRGGLADLAQMPASLWWSMIAAGVFNFIAFIAITTAMKVLPIVAVHLLNASQVAMAAMAGVVLFAEPVTTTLVIGIVLTMLGLLVLARRRPSVQPG
ncbi:DMT family transporter [Aporhodopirellula aestuarii]|uniref:DMT family transporter n=1 Tax=Aporhodopirellula aestuarii TaxID=2950107 RepID=A0ABT0TWX8_9BACT|nr:DMT family transporter [Aporhodopirellula aestuarii]MCM2369055.1 DMT family transporter [Aporhodopirellula aestuarii]